jgi:carbon starvation protein
VVIGASNMMGKIGLPETVGITLMGVFIASFAGTTLDTSVRIQRYVIGEIATDMKIRPLANRWVATTIAVATAAALAFTTGADGKGAMTLWPLFGSANQLLASLALLVVTMYLKQKGGLKYLTTAVPCVIMLVVAGWSMLVNEKSFIDKQDWLLAAIGGGVFLLAVWMTIETVILFFAGANRSPQRQSV